MPPRRRHGTIAHHGQRERAHAATTFHASSSRAAESQRWRECLLSEPSPARRSPSRSWRQSRTSWSKPCPWQPRSCGEVRRYPARRARGGGRRDAPTGRASISVDSARHAVATDEGEVSYDALLLALGAVSKPALEGALTFRGPEDERRSPTFSTHARDRIRTPTGIRSPSGPDAGLAPLRARARDPELPRRPRRPRGRHHDRHAGALALLTVRPWSG